MSQHITPAQEEPIISEMRSILRPMINTALSEMPKDPVIKIFFYLYLFLFI